MPDATRNTLLQQSDTGSEAWWQAIAAQGTPLIEAASPEQCRVTFLWRDPEGTAEHSATRRVWLNITGVTDHHQAGVPQSLERLPGTDAWWFEITLPATWRGAIA